MEREVGAGIGMGNTCKPMAVSFQCMTKSTTKKINKKKKKNHGITQVKKKKKMLFPGGFPPPHGHMSPAHGAASPLFSRERPALSFGATSGQTPPAASPGHLHSS